MTMVCVAMVPLNLICFSWEPTFYTVLPLSVWMRPKSELLLFPPYLPTTLKKRSSQLYAAFPAIFNRNFLGDLRHFTVHRLRRRASPPTPPGRRPWRMPMRIYCAPACLTAAVRWGSLVAVFLTWLRYGWNWSICHSWAEMHTFF